MTTQLQKYTNAVISVVKPNGALLTLTEHASLTVDSVANANPVFTVNKGFAGMSPGSPMNMLTVENAVPSVGFELDPTQFITELEPCKFMIVAASSIMQFDGIVTECNFSHAVNSEAKLSFKASGVFAPWQTI